MAPTIILVRHAQALHNLSVLGRAQCNSLKENLVPKITGPNAELDVGLIIVSPMRRTIETALLAFGELGIPMEAHAGWQENSTQPCDTGSPIPSLRQEFPQVNFDHVDPVYPDKTSPSGKKYFNTKQAIMARGQEVLRDLKQRKEKAIIVVSHSGFLRSGVTGRWFMNADYRVFDFVDEDGEKDESGLVKIKEREWTVKEGGLGWSFEEAVELGDGLPDEEPALN
ncbi:histidine phosphatase superfamily [Apiosordaria backusii]|uniref:Histidine phosphatase superfamily n=1 Tax=Apiosordaria backusii TaxID=314023 RepID=A0AA39ZPF5_9PEZI|nr:histidine phosphatase superfamily [Apiosordaria backusii]